MDLNLYSLERDCVGVQHAYLREIADQRLRAEAAKARAGRRDGRMLLASALFTLAAWLDPSVRGVTAGTLRPSGAGDR